ncbi:MAG: LLM class F420-dependent oxidoreductase, partial [Candidatus Methylomirabilales bacterium]
MRIGVHLASFSFPDSPASIAPTLARVGQVSAAIGADSISLMDHYFQMDQWAPAEEPMLEGYTGLGYLAAHTSTVRLG